MICCPAIFAEDRYDTAEGSGGTENPEVRLPLQADLSFRAATRYIFIT